MKEGGGMMFYPKSHEKEGEPVGNRVEVTLDVTPSIGHSSVTGLPLIHWSYDISVKVDGVVQENYPLLERSSHHFTTKKIATEDGLTAAEQVLRVYEQYLEAVPYTQVFTQ
jgi:hypothetical protein